MAKLFIAEKKDIATAMADYLWPNGYIKKSHYFCNQDDHENCVTWGSGHILALAGPNEYAQWAGKRDYYPLFPDEREWLMVPRSDTKEQLKAIGELLKKFKTVVNGGDADREGQLLIDEVLKYFNYKGEVLRIFITAKDAVSMKRAFENIQDNKKYHSLYLSGVARSHADWLVGMNLSRAYNAAARRSGYPIFGDYRFRIGRVMTPTLALVVRRAREIQNFKSSKYYALLGTFRKEGTPFTCTLALTDEMPLDENGHITDKKVLDSIVETIKLEPGTVTSVIKKKCKTSPPLPHSLDTLQIEANKKLHLSPAETLSIVQSLYEKKYVSYPRSDCNYLPTSQQVDAPVILENLANSQIPGVFTVASQADPSYLSSKCWNDKKVTVHTAIIPTCQAVEATDLSQEEKNVYWLIAQNYMMQFFPDFEYMRTDFTVQCGDYTFKGNGKEVLARGFKNIFSNDSDEEENNSDSENSALPVLVEGDHVGTGNFAIREKNTTPPKPFTEGTLIAAMANIWRFLAKDNPNIERLKEVKGIGTPATRSSIVAKLLSPVSGGTKKSAYLMKDKKGILAPTELGCFTIDHIDKTVSEPDLTAVFEYKLAQIVKDESLYGPIMADIESIVKNSIAHADNSTFPPPSPDMVLCPLCHKNYLVRSVNKTTKQVYYSCNSGDCLMPSGKKMYYTEVNHKPLVVLCPHCNMPLRINKTLTSFFCEQCNKRFKNVNNAPGEEMAAPTPLVRTEDSVDCPVCHKGFLVRRINKNGTPFYYCSDYNCKVNEQILFYNEKDGKPLIVPCPSCNLPMNLIHKKDGAYTYHCLKCNNWFDADENLNPIAIPCIKCKGFLHRFVRKTDGKIAYRCDSCNSYFDDDNGKPVEQKVKVLTRPDDAVDCPVCHKGFLVKRHRKSDGTAFWICSERNCTKNGKTIYYDDKNGVPVFPPACPLCGEFLNHVTTKNKKSVFRCDHCNKWFDDKDGKPVEQSGDFGKSGKSRVHKK